MRVRQPIAVLAALLVGAVCLRASAADTDGPSFPGIVDHFKYGSIGAEEGTGVPVRIWRVLPEVCAEFLPARPGVGYERLGFIQEGAGHGRPVGTCSGRDAAIGSGSTARPATSARCATLREPHGRWWWACRPTRWTCRAMRGS